MSGRIKDARTEIVLRIEKLQGMPGLHAEEHPALADALSSLRFLELGKLTSFVSSQCSDTFRKLRTGSEVHWTEHEQEN